ncbi:hypothetical protein AB0B25_09360 [Nocardia sp. NPDC049190]|uniref:WXG100 family type VII secretion target n=1 Tax=Nocardia sp. NPDC049190 TaxID=3155650 RepID=UPI0033E62938
MKLTVPTVLAWQFDSVDRIASEISATANEMRSHTSDVRQLVKQSSSSLRGATGEAFRRVIGSENSSYDEVSDLLQDFAQHITSYGRSLEGSVRSVRAIADEVGKSPFDLFLTDDGRVLSRKTEKQIVIEYGQEYSDNVWPAIRTTTDQLTDALRFAMKEIERIDNEAAGKFSDIAEKTKLLVNDIARSRR